MTTLVIQKYVEGTENQPMKGVEFLVTDSSGAVVGPNNGYYYTDKDGRITISNLEPGVTITARETKTLAGFLLDGTPRCCRDCRRWGRRSRRWSGCCPSRSGPQWSGAWD